MKLNKTADKTELSKIIKTLIAFIVIDGKDLVNEEAKETYIKKYVYTLSKCMNGENNFVNVSSIWKTIERDVSTLLQDKIVVNKTE